GRTIALQKWSSTCFQAGLCDHRAELRGGIWTAAEFVEICEQTPNRPRYLRDLARPDGIFCPSLAGPLSFHWILGAVCFAGDSRACAVSEPLAVGKRSVE